MPLAPPSEIVAALKDYRLTVVEWPGWRTRGRPYPFDPFGQAWHHDAFQEQYDDEAAARFMAELGRPDLPPPLSNGAIGNFSTVYLTAYGNANHAGRNEADVIDRLRRGLAPRGDASADPDGDTVVGNSHLWGWECRNAGDGHDPWDQLDAMMRAGAAMADCCGWSAMASAGHRELTARKIDPAGFDMTAFRAGIARAQVSHHAPQEDDMPTNFTEDTVDDWSGALRTILQFARDAPGALRKIIAQGEADAGDDVDEEAVARLVLAGLDPAVIAAAIPADLAKQVADELATRLHD